MSWRLWRSIRSFRVEDVVLERLDQSPWSLPRFWPVIFGIFASSQLFAGLCLRGLVEPHLVVREVVLERLDLGVAAPEDLQHGTGREPVDHEEDHAEAEPSIHFSLAVSALILQFALDFESRVCLLRSTRGFGMLHS